MPSIKILPKGILALAMPAATAPWYKDGGALSAKTGDWLLPVVVLDDDDDDDDSNDVDSRTANGTAVEKEMECRWGGANDCTVVVKAAMMARRTSKLLLLLLQLRTVSVMVSLSF
jgi:hypothetical protein